MGGAVIGEVESFLFTISFMNENSFGQSTIIFPEFNEY